MLTTTADGLLDDRGRVFGPHERGRMTVPLVTPGAGGFRVNATISARFRAVIVGGRPERGRSCRPATPCSANRRRSRLTCTTVYPDRRATSTPASPWAIKSTARARRL